MAHEVIVGLGFGDEGKGSCVDWLCATRDIKAVIRYNGGAQAAHNVVRPDGLHHTFAQFGSGTFSGVPTHLSEYVLVNPFNMYREAEHLAQFGLGDPFDITTISRDALLITPYHIAANRLREGLRGDARHGSTGQGIGETRAYALRFPKIAPRIGDIKTPYVLQTYLENLLKYYKGTMAGFEPDESPRDLVAQYTEMLGCLQIVDSDYINKLLDSGDCVFEGAQGVLLDEIYGFHPHTTWTKTTACNAHLLLDRREADVIGVTRTYHTRHGAGPFPTESDFSGHESYLPEPHNKSTSYAGQWRIGQLDLSLLNYAVRANQGVDKIMLTHCDVLDNGLVMAITYGYDNYVVNQELTQLPVPGVEHEAMKNTKYLETALPKPYDFWDLSSILEGIEMATGVKPSILSYGPTWKDKKVAERV